MKSLGIAVWGLGNHAYKRILPVLSSIKDLSLVGVCSRTEKKVLECAAYWKCKGWTNYEDMLNDPSVDIVYLATPIGVHFNLAVQILESGKHVWCEKPLTCNYKNTITLINLAKKNKRMLAESFMYLYHPQFTKLKNLVNDIKFGDIHSIICRFGMPTLKEPGFRHNPKLCGGALWDVGSYTVSAVLALFPNQHVELLFSEISKKNNFKVDTDGRALLRFRNGVTVYLEWGIGVAYKNEIDLWSEKGSFFTDKIFSKPGNYQPYYRTRDENGKESIEYGENCEQFEQMFYHYLSTINSSLKIEEEYVSIKERARVMNEIIKYDTLKKILKI